MVTPHAANTIDGPVELLANTQRVTIIVVEIPFKDDAIQRLVHVRQTTLVFAPSGLRRRLLICVTQLVLRERSFSSVKHLLLCRIEGRPARLDVAHYSPVSPARSRRELTLEPVPLLKPCLNRQR
jgi:hypothetical protein